MTFLLFPSALIQKVWRYLSRMICNSRSTPTRALSRLPYHPILFTPDYATTAFPIVLQPNQLIWVCFGGWEVVMLVVSSPGGWYLLPLSSRHLSREYLEMYSCTYMNLLYHSSTGAAHSLFSITTNGYDISQDFLWNILGNIQEVIFRTGCTRPRETFSLSTALRPIELGQAGSLKRRMTSLA